MDAAYRNWMRAARSERPGAFDDYLAALDREEGAASEYQRLIELATISRRPQP